MRGRGVSIRSRIVGTIFCLTVAVASVSVVACDGAVPHLDDRDVRVGEHAVTAAVSPAPVPPCATRGVAVTANTGQVVAHASSLVDAYDSGAGGYGGGNSLVPSAVRASTDVVADAGANITGERVDHSPAGLAQIATPTGATKLPLGSSTPGNVTINGASDSITLAPGNYVVRNFTVNSPGRVNLSGSGTINIFVTGSLNLGGLENNNGVPRRLTFFVQSSTAVNVNSNGRLFGSIYAPKSPVNLNSPVFGSVVGRQVTLNSGSAVHQDRALRCPPPPVAVHPPRTLPLPPREKGCYLGGLNGWAEVPCTTKDELAPQFSVPYPELAIQSIPSAQQPTAIPLEYGEVDVTLANFTSVATDGSDDAFAVQANTNAWIRPDGKQGWTQFVVSTESHTSQLLGSKMAVCVWDFVDSQFPILDYFVTCVGGGTSENSNVDAFHLDRRPGPFQQYDFATIGSSTFTVGAEPRLGLVARVSWFDPANEPSGYKGLYAVVVADHSGLAGNWTDISGGIFGEDSSSTAYFTGSSVLTRILAGSCVNAPAPKPEIPWPGLCPNQPPLLPNTRLAETNVTAEENNLIVVGQPQSLASVTPDLVFTQFLASDTGECQAGADRVYVKDHPSDTGMVPSNSDGQPFWQSPDLFVVPQGATVVLDTAAPYIVLTPGEMYDAYVRVNNEYSCNAVSGVKARLHLANPSALSAEWQPITESTYSGGTSNLNGISVPAGARALVGPFPFRAPTADLGDGHKCVVASIMSANQPAPANPFDAPGSYQVAQRNLSLGVCAYPLTNATTSNGTVELTLRVEGGMPGVAQGNDISVKFFDPTGAWHSAWQGQAGTAYAVSHSVNDTTVRLGQREVTLAPVPLPAGTTVAAQGHVEIQEGELLTTLSLGAVLKDASGNTLVSNGGSCDNTSTGPILE